MQAPGAEPKEVESKAEEISPWDLSTTAKGGLGYKDNVLLSDFNKESSFFTFLEGELFLYRVPVDGWEFSGLLSAEDRRYWQSSTVDKEQLFIASMDLKRSIGERWKAGTTAQYIYNDQMFDASVTEGIPVRVQSKMHRIAVTPEVNFEFAGNRRVEVSALGARQLFEQPLDDYWEAGSQVLFAQKYGHGSEVGVSFIWGNRGYDTREQPGGVGSLHFIQKEVEVGVRHYWDAEKVWYSRGRTGFEANTDNGDGFYDYHKWRLSHDLTFTRGRFEGMLLSKLLYYEYASQTVASGDARYRTEITLGVRLRQGITKSLSVFADYEYERVWGNEVTDRYVANTIMGGLEWEIK